MTVEGNRGAVLELRNLVKSFGSAVAVDGISIDVAPGEFLTLLGPSGSGKTTTLNMIAGFLWSDSGEILLDRRPIGRLPAHKRKIGMVFQHYALFPHMTAFDNVAFPLKQRRVRRSEIQSRVGATLDLVDLGDFAGRYPRQLSGGQQQRVALARAIVFEPSLLLMDEPLGALDKQLRQVLQMEIKRIHREIGITFVYVTHDQEEAIALSDRVAVFNNGRIEQIGSPKELYERPATLFAARFLGESNILRGQTHASDASLFVLPGGTVLHTPPGRNLGEGEAGLLVVRPEELRIRPAGSPAGDHENAVPATIAQVDYMGPTQRVELTLASGETCVVREQTGALSGGQRGDLVVVSWDRNRGVVLPAAEHSELAAGPDLPSLERAGEETWTI